MSTAHFRTKINDLFPGAIIEEEFVQLAVIALKSTGFRVDNSIACVAVCRDEICSPFVRVVNSHFGLSFSMRGLGGFISCGNTGFGAAHAHAPMVDDRRRYVYFVAPHIAIDEKGSVRHVKRARIEAKSTACGALCALEADIKAQKVDLAINEDDMEQSLLRKALAPKLEEGDGYKVVSLADLTKLAESVIVEEQLQGHIDATVDTSKADYAIVAGIQVHGPDGKTYFYQVPEHCVTCIHGKTAPLTIGEDVTMTPPMEDAIVPILESTLGAMAEVSKVIKVGKVDESQEKGDAKVAPATGDDKEIAAAAMSS